MINRTNRQRVEDLGDAHQRVRPWMELQKLWLLMLVTLKEVLATDEASALKSLLFGCTAEERTGFFGVESKKAWPSMWTLPPCSEARKAAFTLGRAAQLIERWRKTGCSGPAAEAALRILAWHTDDARAERAAVGLVGPPMIPPHERVYTWERRWTDRWALVVAGGAHYGSMVESTKKLVLYDHFERLPKERDRMWAALSRSRSAQPFGLDERAFYLSGFFGDRFAEAAVAALPEEMPWIMTSADISRFLDAFVEDL